MSRVGRRVLFDSFFSFFYFDVFECVCVLRRKRHCNVWVLRGKTGWRLDSEIKVEAGSDARSPESRFTSGWFDATASFLWLIRLFFFFRRFLPKKNNWIIRNVLSVSTSELLGQFGLVCLWSKSVTALMWCSDCRRTSASCGRWKYYHWFFFTTSRNRIQQPFWHLL